MATLNIIVGSVYGNAENVAEEVQSYCEDQGIDAEVFKDPDVSDFTDRSFEQLGMFDHWHTDFLIAVLPENPSNGGFNVLPDRCLVRENIVHPPDCLNLCQNNILIGF